MYGRPTPDSNWGLCSEWCPRSHKVGPSAVLQETQLDVLTMEECEVFAGKQEKKASIAS